VDLKDRVVNIVTGAGDKPSAQLPDKLVKLGAFLLPGLSLALPSGYSWGVLLLVVAGVAAMLARARKESVPPPVPTPLLAFAVAIAVVGLLLLLRTDVDWAAPEARQFERSIKFALVLLAIPALAATPALATPLFSGVWLGALAAGAVAAWQLWRLNGDRAYAFGFTNAIAFGDLALLLALWSAVGWQHAKQSLTQWIAAGAVAAACFAVIASGTRGAWFTAPLLVPLLLCSRSRSPAAAPSRLRWQSLGIVVLVLLGGLWAAMEDGVHRRVQDAAREVVDYWYSGRSETSIGQRLAHAKLAWEMGWDRPLLGWGKAGYVEEKQRRVDAQQAPEILLRFGHAHNEWLDLWAKAGLLGVLALALFYGVPLAIYSRALRYADRQVPAHLRDQQRALATSGLILVLGYIGFGMTQVMLAHNSSLLFYLFMNLLWIAALQPPRKTAANDASTRGI
jgi:O-antigen ligase